MKKKKKKKKTAYIGIQNRLETASEGDHLKWMIRLKTVAWFQLNQVNPINQIAVQALLPSPCKLVIPSVKSNTSFSFFC